MAQKYVVKNEDNPLTLAKKFETSPQAILQNNAIKSLTAGQTIKIPSTGFQTPTTNGFTTASKTPNGNSGGGQYSTAQTENNYVYKQPTGSFISNAGNTAITYNPTPVYGYSTAQTENPFVYKFPTSSFLSNNGNTALTYNSQNAPAPSFFLNNQQQQQARAQGSFVSGGGQVNLQGQQKTSTQLTGGSFYNGSGEINLTGVVPGGGSGGGSNNSYSRPTGIYTGGNSANDIAWRNYWNYSAANPQTVENPVSTYMPTRNDIWEMKAAQRRRENGGGNSGYSYQQPVYTPPTQIGNNIVGGSWRVG